MPELPDLEAIRARFEGSLRGLTIEGVEVLKPIIVRAPVEDFQGRLGGASFESVGRRGKFLLFSLSTGDVLVVNPMLSGRFQFVEPSYKRPARTCVVLALSDGRELRYVDDRFMGKIYLAPRDELDAVPQFAEMGPDALDPELTEAMFLQRLRRYRGQVKNVLVNHKFIAGIGNAYADEILLVAGIHPFTKVTQLDETRRRRLYRAVRDVLEWAIPIVRDAMDEDPERKFRDFLRVHRKGGQPCPQCGTLISEVSPNRRVTSFCRRCQPS